MTTRKLLITLGTAAFAAGILCDSLSPRTNGSTSVLAKAMGGYNPFPGGNSVTHAELQQALTNMGGVVYLGDFVDATVSIGGAADGRYGGIAIGAGSLATNMGTGIGRFTAGSDYGVAMGNYADGHNCGLAFGTYAIAPSNNTVVGSFGTAYLLSAALGGNSVAWTRSVSLGFDSIAKEGSVASGFRASAQGEYNVALGYRAAVGIVGTGWRSDFRPGLPGWTTYVESLFVSGAPDTSANGTYTLDSQGGDCVWAVFTKPNGYRVEFMTEWPTSVFSVLSIYDGDTLVYCHAHASFEPWSDLLSGTISGLVWSISQDGGTTDEIVIEAGNTSSDESLIGSGAIGYLAYAGGSNNTNTWAYGYKATNITANSHFFVGDISTSNTVTASKFQLGDGSYITRTPAGDLILVDGVTTNTLTLGPAPQPPT